MTRSVVPQQDSRAFPSGGQWREGASQQIPIPNFPSEVVVQLGLGV